ncbi:uncharacterized protein BJ212DRAFT_1294729 [Suillus subaureus]|uniref:Uncharacterized protein n=1 Tax=Suillus subaureus TaxID=48587 RepID=A0A9P7JKD5_9AGAM|nr:uncharacterized protein BJ212DRAFT_1294729 [Suillus subaureus]KAG1827456.1 hypothetical protein BJ212DRAFT_1294729 [Suillus subaureus]
MPRSPQAYAKSLSLSKPCMLVEHLAGSADTSHRKSVYKRGGKVSQWVVFPDAAKATPAIAAADMIMIICSYSLVSSLGREPKLAEAAASGCEVYEGDDAGCWNFPTVWHVNFRDLRLKYMVPKIRVYQALVICKRGGWRQRWTLHTWIKLRVKLGRNVWQMMVDNLFKEFKKPCLI